MSALHRQHQSHCMMQSIIAQPLSGIFPSTRLFDHFRNWGSPEAAVFTAMRVEFDQLIEVFPNASSALRTTNVPRRLLLCRDSAARAEPTSTDPSFVRHLANRRRFFGQPDLVYVTFAKALCEMLRQFHLTAYTQEFTAHFFKNIAALRTVHLTKILARVNEGFGPATASGRFKAQRKLAQCWRPD